MKKIIIILLILILLYTYSNLKSKNCIIDRIYYFKNVGLVGSGGIISQHNPVKESTFRLFI